MRDKIKLTIFSEGQDEIEVDREEYESAKADGDLDQMLDVYLSDIECDLSILEPDGTVVTLPEGNVLQPRSDTPVHDYFGLTYANYEVTPRTLAQSMPVAWQERWVECQKELRAAFAHIEHPAVYDVTPAEEVEYGDLTDEQRKRLGVTECEGSDENAWGLVYYLDADGHEHDSSERALVSLGDDPIPHYNRGRTFIAPKPAEAAS